jgi:vacuolar-type H+-ATPase subunit H
VQFQAETEKRIAGLKAEEDALKKSTADWKAKEKANEGAALEVIEEANNKAKTIIADANAKANQTLGKAVLDADKQKQEALKAEKAAADAVAAKKQEALDWEAQAAAFKAAVEAHKAALAG